MGAGLGQTPRFSKQHAYTRRVGPLQVAAAGGNDILTALAMNDATMALGKTLAPTTALVIGVTGRNLVLVVTDANDSSVSAYMIQGINQFGEAVEERFPQSGNQAGHGTITGKKIFTKVTGIVILTNTAPAAADNVKIGSGNVVGLDFMFSSDLSEIADAELQVANQATAPGKIAITAANFDSDYFAIKAAAFAASAVVAGDSVNLRVRTTDITPDDVTRYPVRKADGQQ